MGWQNGVRWVAPIDAGAARTIVADYYDPYDIYGVHRLIRGSGLKAEGLEAV